MSWPSPSPRPAKPSKPPPTSILSSNRRPGDGIINLELARLAAKQGNERLAIQRYQAALDGTWEGNGYDRRREVRLELVNYYLSRKEYTSARTQLLIAASNAPDDPADQGPDCGSAGKAHRIPADALNLYRSIAARPRRSAGRLRRRRTHGFQSWVCFESPNAYLSRALSQSCSRARSAREKAADQYMANTASHILLLFPALDLSPRSRAERILYLRKIARNRLSACTTSNAAAPPKLASIVSRWDQTSLPTAP